ncbi:hypothetical protein EVAR_81848_1 [Eumeta japonica]|uniref:Uncharacterized protein n=1 Tax=Eumeta variegata TaxID=151549 RepID=A0A4C1XSQ3_EUMVA|nr:hypothetical protein EVAR_81848_1 [Eumeta japonica]
MSRAIVSNSNPVQPRAPRLGTGAPGYFRDSGAFSRLKRLAATGIPDAGMALPATGYTCERDNCQPTKEFIARAGVANPVPPDADAARVLNGYEEIDS